MWLEALTVKEFSRLNIIYRHLYMNIQKQCVAIDRERKEWGPCGPKNKTEEMPFYVVALILLISRMELLIISSEFEWKQEN